MESTNGALTGVMANLKSACSAMLLLVLVALPFDNALYHVSAFLLLVTIGLVISETGWRPTYESVRTHRSVHLAFAAIIIIMLTANLTNGQNGEAWRTLFVFALRYWLFLVALIFLLRTRLVGFGFVLLACAVSLLVQFLPFVLSIVDQSIFLSRFEGFSSNPNIIGLYAGLGALLGIYMLTQMQALRWPTILGAVALTCLAVVILVASGNRGGWLAFTAALLVFSVGNIKRQPSVILGTTGMVVIGLAWLFANNALPAHRLQLLVSGYPSLRDEVWENSINLFWERPLFGYGLDTREALLASHQIYSEHNVFLSVLLALGLAGLTAYLVLLFLICRTALQQRNVFGLTLMVFLTSVGMFGFDFYRDQTFMVLFILVSSYCLVAKTDLMRRR